MMPEAAGFFCLEAAVLVAKCPRLSGSVAKLCTKVFPLIIPPDIAYNGG